MKLSDYKGEAALDLLADLIDPISEITSDAEMKSAIRNKSPRSELIKLLISRHKKSILEIMARINGEDPSTYAPTVFELPIMLMELLSDESVIQLFRSQVQTSVEEPSGPATETTEA
jgi:hypothetical protein